MSKSRLNLAYSMLTPLLVGAAITACDTAKNVDTTTKNTSSLNNKMSSMNTQMGDVNSKMGEMNSRISNMDSSMNRLNHLALDLHRGAAASLRDQFLIALDDATTLPAKIDQGVKYHAAFSFQMWKGEAEDTDAVRLAMFNSAMEEYFKGVQNFYSEGTGQVDKAPASGKTTSEKLTSTEMGDANDLNSTYALAITMHRLNPEQETWAATHKNFVTRSMMDIIVDGLLKIQTAKGQVDDQPLYVKEIAKNKSLAVDLLKMRFNLAVLLALKTSTDLAEKSASWAKKLSNPVTDQLELSPARLDNTATIGYTKSLLMVALQVKQILASLGQTVPQLTISQLPLQLLVSKVQLPGDVRISANNTVVKELKGLYLELYK